MVSNNNALLTETNISIIIILNLVGSGILSLPRDIINASNQSGWIAIIIGTIYPIILVISANYMKKKFPNDDILSVNKKLYGKILGTIFNLMYVLFFVYLCSISTAGMSNILIIYSVNFLDNWNIVTMSFLVVAYATYKGINTIGTKSEVLFFATCVVYLIPIFSIIHGDWLNMKPVFEINMPQLMKATKSTALSYAGTEILFLVYPFMKKDKDLIKCSLKAVIFSMIIYTAYVLVAIMYLGVSGCTKFMWPVVTVTESVTIPIINNFRYIFMAFWSINMLVRLGIHYFAIAHSLNRIIPKVSREKWSIIIYPIMVILTLIYKNETYIKQSLLKDFPLCVMYNIVFFCITFLLMFIKKGDKYEKKSKKHSS